jgi:YbbR domain-containing protein
MKFITKNTTIKVISLILAIILWVFVKSKSGGEVGLVVPLEFYRVPPSLIVTNVTDEAINVRINGSFMQLERLSTKEVRARIDLSRARPGMNSFDILPDNFNIPKTLDITQISPSSVKVELDNVIEKMVHVKPVVKGKPARGYRATKISADPPYINLQGARGQLTGLKEVSTEEVDISDLKETVEVEVPLQIADLRLKKAVKRMAKVTIMVEEEQRKK